jgi:hypothetical protein
MRFGEHIGPIATYSLIIFLIPVEQFLKNSVLKNHPHSSKKDMCGRSFFDNSFHNALTETIQNSLYRLWNFPSNKLWYIQIYLTTCKASEL